MRNGYKITDALKKYLSENYPELEFLEVDARQPQSEDIDAATEEYNRNCELLNTQIKQFLSSLSLPEDVASGVWSRDYSLYSSVKYDCLKISKWDMIRHTLINNKFSFVMYQYTGPLIWVYNWYETTAIAIKSGDPYRKDRYGLYSQKTENYAAIEKILTKFFKEHKNLFPY